MDIEKNYFPDDDFDDKLFESLFEGKKLNKSAFNQKLNEETLDEFIFNAKKDTKPILHGFGTPEIIEDITDISYKFYRDKLKSSHGSYYFKKSIWCGELKPKLQKELNKVGKDTSLYATVYKPVTEVISAQKKTEPANVLVKFEVNITGKFPDDAIVKLDNAGENLIYIYKSKNHSNKAIALLCFNLLTECQFEGQDAVVGKVQELLDSVKNGNRSGIQFDIDGRETEAETGAETASSVETKSSSSESPGTETGTAEKETTKSAPIPVIVKPQRKGVINAINNMDPKEYKDLVKLLIDNNIIKKNSNGSYSRSK